MLIENYGFPFSDMTNTGSGTPARVTAVYRNSYEIVCNNGSGMARLRPGQYYSGEQCIPTTGDFVLIDWQENGQNRILKTLPRKTFFSRLDPSSSGHREQAVAANFDYVFILQSLNRDFNPRRLERYLALAWQSGATPAVILTKADELEDVLSHVLAVKQAAIGVDVFAISAKTGYGLNQLEPYLKPGKTVVLLGSSGVGKSTLVNALADGEVMATSSIREKDGRGRHKTSHRQLVLLKNGAMVIDTPGMRELGIWDASEGLSQSFSDVEQYFGQCRFRDCRHQGEPGCAVQAAIRNGALSADRWASYKKLHTEAQYFDDKASYLQAKQKRLKEISKLSRAMRELDYRHSPCMEQFHCKACGALITPEAAGSQHRNHCPHCLSSIHVDNQPGDRECHCKGIMEPVAVWVRKNGEWALIHRCRDCGTLHSNRIAADDNAELLLQIAMKPLKLPYQGKEQQPTPHLENTQDACGHCGAPLHSVPGKRAALCPQCLTSVHVDNQPGDGASLCKGRMEPIAVWVQDFNMWNLILRCKSCGTLKTAGLGADENSALLMSLALKPLAMPPFPLWKPASSS